MSSSTKFVCDFCFADLTDKAKFAGQCGFCFTNEKWSRNLSNKYEGPHICKKCVENLVDFIEDEDE